MPVLEMLLIAVGLSMDSFAVSIAAGAGVKRPEMGAALKMGAFFGGFQAAMPVIGWLAGAGMKGFIAGADHWIAFVLLTLVGGKMIHEGVISKTNSEGRTANRPFETATLFALATATSIDALAVGVTFSMLDFSIIPPAIIIGLTTFALSVAGVQIGAKGGRLFENKMEILGGLILMGIGCNILFKHLK